jgi:hypothetical protein
MKMTCLSDTFRYLPPIVFEGSKCLPLGRETSKNGSSQQIRLEDGRGRSNPVPPPGGEQIGCVGGRRLLVNERLDGNAIETHAFRDLNDGIAVFRHREKRY